MGAIEQSASSDAWRKGADPSHPRTVRRAHKQRLAIDPIDPPRGAVSINTRAAAVMPASEVYFIVGCASHLIKIGYAKDAWKRMSTLQTGATEELRMLAIIETLLPVGLERDLHAHFAQQHVRGEWFRITDELVDYALKWGRSQWEDY